MRRPNTGGRGETRGGLDRRGGRATAGRQPGAGPLVRRFPLLYTGLKDTEPGPRRGLRAAFGGRLEVSQDPSILTCFTRPTSRLSGREISYALPFVLRGERGLRCQARRFPGSAPRESLGGKRAR